MRIHSHSCSPSRSAPHRPPRSSSPTRRAPTPPSRPRSRPRRPTGRRASAGDETMQQCSAHRNSPPKAVADAIQKREKASIVYPADNNFIGDWKKGEALAQSGYGLRFTDYPARQANGGNCYACHQITKKRSELRHARPELRNTASCATSSRPTPRRLREDLQFARRLPVLDHAALRRQQDADHRADQGHGGAADGEGQPGEYREVSSAASCSLTRVRRRGARNARSEGGHRRPDQPSALGFASDSTRAEASSKIKRLALRALVRR